ncbi:MAG: hypothetical protein K2O24_00895 [Muribaculaceae bacterium]|nr:hypothetical protein [Muribaculaceae bacterium]
MKRNQFSKLRKAGIAGHLYEAQPVKVTTVWSYRDSVICVHSTRIKEGVYTVGWHIQTPAMKSDMQVWEGAGWFDSESDAGLWLFGEIMAKDWVNEKETPGLRETLERECRKLMQKSIFDI